MRTNTRCILSLVWLPLILASHAVAQQPVPLHFFPAHSGSIGSDASLIQGADGKLYGWDSGDGTGYGTIFSLTLDGVEADMHTFSGPDGEYLQGNLVQGGDGYFYGVDYAGGGSYGTIFAMTPAGSLATVYEFTNGADGGFPNSPLVQGADGNFYGTGWEGGTSSYGTVFKYVPGGAVTTLHVFTGGADGGAPRGGLLQASDGNFYGVASMGGANGDGVVYRVSASGVFSVIYNFTGGDDGSGPEEGLVEAGDGYLYSISAGQGASGPIASVLYKVSTSGVLGPFVTFTQQSGLGIPNMPLLASDGNFYFSSEVSGADHAGVFFEETLSASTHVLSSILPPDDQAGTDPDAPLMQASDGNFYGDTSKAAENGTGSVFVLAPTSLPAPVQLTLSTGSSVPASPVTLAWSVLNAFSMTMQQCYAFVQNGASGAGSWTGKQAGTLGGGIFAGAATITPTAPGRYTYALTCGGTESGFATLTVAYPTTTSLVTAPRPASVGQPLTFTATVAHAAGTAKPTGTVTFSYGSVALSQAAISTSGVATFTIGTAGLPPGSYPITASYSGDSNYSASSSSATAVVLAAAPTTTVLAATPSPVTPPATLTLTATVKRSASGAAGTPTGQVTFYYATTALDTANLNASGVATYTISTNGLPPGSYPITAKYSGDTSDSGSTATAIPVTVK